MDFTFTEDQLLFCDSVKNFLQAEITPESLRASWDTDTGRSDELWQTIVELGLTAMLVPEAQGGLGMNELDFILLAQECGRVALAEALVETALVATPLLSALVDKDPRCASLLEKIASGEIRVAVGHPANELVSDAHVADWLLLPSGDQIHLLARDQVKLVTQHSVDPSRRLFTVEWKATDETCLAGGPEGVQLLAASLNRGALGCAAQLVGLAEAMVSLTVDYTADRHQFGKAIGTNQALKHHMANCAVKSEFAKAPLYRAAYTLSKAPQNADFAVSHAKVAAGEAALLAAKNAIQSFGAMGYTWECDLHIFMKRAWALDKFWGHTGFHKNRLHQWLMNPNAKIGADKTFGIQG
ncbi:acyl-CoA/acyl-ACP dehydrogenase [Aestuariicella hydrocarbonica]|uniref:Acyl-CoA/acyl-ACP dehydrogenase n=1 Tax=Pseudomaricurvus hydrocarbonicus TaxID=1470433 RepID=A0A9E5MM24_9GAMM|nr:acyl-CoA dehydrogenase family protein [Aestuariicella hydrocarbonica]NHO66083.1 acyl-CoA/acyl-ACP dehydrogenase [Aestuariicella hydrocarbonica]